MPGFGELSRVAVFAADVGKPRKLSPFRNSLLTGKLAARPTKYEDRRRQADGS